MGFKVGNVFVWLKNHSQSCDKLRTNGMHVEVID